MSDTLASILKRAEEHGVLQRKVVKGGETEYLPTHPGEASTANKQANPCNFGELCPYCGEYCGGFIEFGWYICPHCKEEFWISDSDSDYVDYHTHKADFLNGAPPKPDKIPVAVDCGESWASKAMQAAMQAEKQHTGAMLALYPDTPPQFSLTDADLTPTEPSELHVTMAYLGDAADLDEEDRAFLRRVCEQIASEFEPIQAKLGGIGRFLNLEDDDTQAYYASVDSPNIEKLRARLVEVLGALGMLPESDHGFTPHMTLAYVPVGKPAAGAGLQEEPVKFGGLSLSLGGERTDFPFKVSGAKQNIMLTYPDESKTWRFVWQQHFRGKSSHGDFRVQSGDYLVGWTIPDQNPGAITEPVETLAQATSAVNNPDLWKMNLATGEIKPREIRSGVVRKGDLRALPKGVEIPEDWLNEQGVTDKPDPGEAIPVGATRNFPGVFKIVDKGTVEHGAKEAWFQEYWIHGDKWGDQRWVFRLLERNKDNGLQTEGNKEEAEEVKADPLPPGVIEANPRSQVFWIFMQPDDPVPYTLSPGAVQKNWLPPKGISALPKAMRDRVPKELRYWDVSGKEALDRRAKLAEMDIRELGGSTAKQLDWKPYYLQRHWFRGPIQVRFGASDQHYDLRIVLNGKHWHLVIDGNPLTNDRLPAYEETKYSGNVATADGKKINVLRIGTDPIELAPGQPANPTKDTPAFIQTVDEGEARVLDSQPEFTKLEFKDGKLKGAWYFRLEEAGSQIGEFGKSEGPQTSAKFSVSQPRDDHGRFASAGGVSFASEVSSGEASSVRSELKSWKGHRKEIAVEATKWAEAGNDLMVKRDADGRMTAIATLTPKASPKFGYPPKEKYKELICLATVEPGHGRGMMQNVFENAAQSKAGIILTAAPAARGFYEKLGFHEGGRKNEFHLTAAEVRERVKSGGKTKDDEPTDGVFVVPGERLLEEEERKREGPVMKGEKGVRPLFGSPGGKRLLAKTIVDLIPPHKVYVEPFAGGAAVLFTKPPEMSEKEVLADADPDIAFAYRTVKGLSDAEIERLNRMEWRIGKFDEVKDSRPDGKLGKLHRWLFLRKGSYGKLGDTPNTGLDGSTEVFARNLPVLRDRLKSVTVHHSDYHSSLRDFDGDGTFFYLDPPYPDTNRGTEKANLRWTSEDASDFADAVKKLKGKWLVSLQDNAANRDLFKSYHIRTVTVPLTLTTSGAGGGKTRKDLLIANYPLPKRVRRKSMDDVEALQLVYTCMGCKGEFESEVVLDEPVCPDCSAKALPWQPYLLQRHNDHHDLRIGDDFTLRLSGTLLDNEPDKAEVSTESPTLQGADGQAVDALKVKPGDPVKLADGEIQTLDKGQARYAKTQSGHQVEFKGGKLEGVYLFGPEGAHPVDLEHIDVEWEPGQPEPEPAEPEGDHPPLFPFEPPHPIDPGLIHPLNPPPLIPQPALPPPGMWYMGKDEVAEGEKVGKRIKTEKLSKLQELRQSLESAVKWLGEVIGWASYQDAPEPTMLEFFKGNDAGFTVKTVQGEPWLFTWSANAFKDREGEIFSTKALENWADAATARQDKGTFNFWHIPGSDFARKRWVGVPGRILVEAGPFTKDEKGKAAQAFFAAYPDRHPTLAPEGWGCSVEYRYLPEERKSKVYRNVEITRTSVLPRFAAANTWTAVKEVTMALTDAQKKAAQELFGEDLAASILGEAEAKTKELEPNVAHKGDGEQTEPEIAPEVQPEAAVTEEVVAEEDKAKKKKPADEEAYPVPEEEKKKPTKAEKKQLDQFVKAIRDVAASVTDDSPGRTAILEVADKLSEENLKDMAGELKKAGKAVKNAAQKARLTKLVEAMAGDGTYPAPGEGEEYPYPKSKEFVEEVAAEISKQFKFDTQPIGEALTATAAALKGLEDRITALETQSGRKAATDLPRFVFGLVEQASKADATIVPEGDKLLDQKPKETARADVDGSIAAHFFPKGK